MWELIFMLLVLKIPIAYLCAVVYWAIRSEPKPVDPAPLLVEPDPPPPWRPRSRARRPRGPHGSPGRAYVRRARAPLSR